MDDKLWIFVYDSSERELPWIWGQGRSVIWLDGAYESGYLVNDK